MNNNDLFPETLVVTVVDGQPMTSSLQIAEHFGKRHDHVMEAIRNCVKRTQQPERLLNFRERFDTYSPSNGAKRQRPIYLLTRKGFEFIVSGFTGATADEWKWQFLDAFEAMEAQLNASIQREAEALYQVKPHWRIIGQAKSQGLTHRQTIAQTGHRCVGTITRNLKRMRDAGLPVPSRKRVA